jgi:hypothetical protein
MLDTKNYIKRVAIAAKVNRTAGVVAGVQISNGSQLAFGEIVVTDLAGRVVNSTTVAGLNRIFIKQGRGGKTPSMNIIEVNKETTNSYVGLTPVPAVEQIDYIGYNGTAGTVEASGGTVKNFIVKVTPLPNTMMYGLVPFHVKNTQFSAAAANTSILNAEGLVKSLISNFAPERQIGRSPRFELVANSTSVVFGTTLASASFVKYSNQVSVTAGADLAGLTILAGSYIRIGGTTAVTGGVYKVKTGVVLTTGASGTITLDWIYQGETATILVAGLTSITAASIATANVGVKLTGQPFAYDVNRWRQYDKMRFETSLVFAFTTTTVTKAQVPSEGRGTWEQVMNDEYISWGDQGQINPMTLPFNPREQDAVKGVPYSTVHLTWANPVNSNFGANNSLIGESIIYLDKTGGSLNAQTQITGATSLMEVLDAFFLGKFAAQAGNV